MVSDRLYREHPTAKNRMLAARALVAAGQPAAALPHLRALLKSGEPEAEETYTAALLSAVSGPGGAATEALRKELRSFWAGKLGDQPPDESKQLELIYGLLDLGAWDDVLPRLKALARHREELAPVFVETAVKAGKRNEAIEFLKSDLTRTDLPEATREARVYALIDSAGPIEALPYMRKLASESRGNWGSAYEEALNKLGRDSELQEFWRARLASSESSPDEKRGIAWKLIDQGKPEWARSVFRELAGAAPPESPDVTEWLFLWGASPPQEVLESLELRARRAYAVERIAWLNRLLEAGGADRVVAVISADPPAAGSGGDLFNVYIRALAARNDIPAVTDAISRETAATSNADRVRQLASLARELGGVSAAGPAYERLAELLPSDPEALHWLGIRDYTRARYSSAERNLSTLLTSAEGTYDDNFYLAEILWRAEKRTQARIYYGRALRMVERMQSPPLEARVAHAQALFRSGYMQQALHEFRQMIVEQPRNGDLRADYAALLLEAGKYNEADDVLASEVETGATRVALLRIQLLSSTGHLPEATSLMQSVAAQDSQSLNPNAGVPAMFATLAQSAGRNRAAEDLIDRAAGLDPRNEDYAAESASIRKDRGTELSIENESQQIQGLQSENIVRMTSRTALSRSLRALVTTEQNQVSVRSMQRLDGSVGSYAGTLRRIEAGVEWESMEGTLLRGSLFSSGGPTGTGFAVTQPDLHGSTSASIEYRKPDWDFAQSLVQGGTRDRIELKRDARLGSRVTAELTVAANRYDLPGVPRAAQSVAVSGNATMTLLRKPHVSAVYTLDGEYRTSVKALESSSGASYLPLPLLSREVHTGAIQIDQQIARGLHATGAAGFSDDRLGGTAPSITGNLTYDRLRHFGAKIDYDRRLYRYGTNQISTTLRAGIFWAF
jgi:thioredoxin-like negative regulator of GroEL